MKKLLLFSLLTFVVGVTIGLYLFSPDTDTASVSKQPVRDFTLDSYNGAVHLHDFEGKLVLLFFGYTSCPDVCPLTLQKLAAMLAQLTEEERKQVQVLFISVDPERDTTKTLRDYTKYFDESIIGLTGSEEQIAHVAHLYAADYKKVAATEGQGADPASSYTMDHTSSVYVIDRDNIWVGLLPASDSVERWAQSIRSLL